MTTIRHVERNDTKNWLEMRRALFSDEPEEHARDIERFFSGESREPVAVLVAEQDGRLVGLAELSLRPYAQGCSSDDVAYLEGWYVRPELRKTGVGRALVAAAEDWARGRGCTEFASDALADNELSSLAHAGCGFEDVGLVRCFRKDLAPDEAAERLHAKAEPRARKVAD